jgi:hypothetical protein
VLIFKPLKIVLISLLLSCSVNAASGDFIYLTIANDTLGLVLPEQVPDYLDETLKHWGNSGYPFAEIILALFEEKDGVPHAYYRLNPGESVSIDTVVFGEFSRRESKRLNRIIHDDLTGPYHGEKIEDALKRLRRNEWLITEDRHDIYGNHLRFYARKVEDFTFDALMSYQSDAGSIVGLAEFNMVNFLGLGRQAEFQWYHPSARTNKVYLQWIEPYLFNSGLSAEIRLKQEHEDTLYVYRDGRIRLIWHGKDIKLGVLATGEKIYTTEAGDQAGISSGSRQLSAIDLMYESKMNESFQYALTCQAGVRTGGDTLQYPVEFNTHIKYSGQSVYFQTALFGGWIEGKGKPAPYQLYRLGGSEFLRGALFEQYRTSGFRGITLEGGFDDGSVRLGLFTDLAILSGSDDMMIHTGTTLILPAGKSKLRLLLGFDIRQPLSNGKFHFGWTF